MLKFIVLSIYIITSYSQSQPTFSEGLLSISKYIAESDPGDITGYEESLTTIDSIYTFAVNTFNNDHSEALLCLTFATLPYSAIPIKTPFFRIGISIYLPSPGKDLFKKRFDRLPGIVFIDSPLNAFGDKDKLSHFFGNAFLSYSTSFFNISKFMGMFVELFENTFKIDGQVDERDLKTNFLGEIFGAALSKKGDLLPSQILKLYSFFYHSSLINYK
jgi:hypothetical protein